MARLLIFLLCSFFPCTVVAASADDIQLFLTSRHVVAQVFFSNQTTELSDSFKQQLNRVASELAGYEKQQLLIRVEGFASSDGEAQYNLNLSLQRALSVANYLQHKHNLGVSVFLTGFGERGLVADKLSEKRRVDIAVYKKNPAVKALFDGQGNVERVILQ